MYSIRVLTELPLGDIIGILRRHIPIQELSVFLSLDLKMLLSPPQVVDVVQTAKARIVSQIKEIQKEISDAKTLSALNLKDKQILNEEGLPIKEIKEQVDDAAEERRGVPFEEEKPQRTYTMEEIDKMMDEAMVEEQAELGQSKQKSKLPEKEKSNGGATRKSTKQSIRAGDGLEVGTVSGEELLAKLMDDSKKRYDPINDTWMENNDELTGEDEEYDESEPEEEEEEEDKYGRTRGYLVPPGLYKGVKQEKGVKFASFEQPATPSTSTPTSPTDKPIKSALKKSTSLSTSDTAPLTSSPIEPPVASEIMERRKSDVPYYLTLLT
jgi:hypothetical protein